MPIRIIYVQGTGGEPQLQRPEEDVPPPVPVPVQAIFIRSALPPNTADEPQFWVPEEDCWLNPTTPPPASIKGIYPSDDAAMQAVAPVPVDEDFDVQYLIRRYTPITYKLILPDDPPYTIVRTIGPGVFLYAESIRATLFAESLGSTLFAESLGPTLFAESLQ